MIDDRMGGFHFLEEPNQTLYKELKEVLNVSNFLLTELQEDNDKCYVSPRKSRKSKRRALQ